MFGYSKAIDAAFERLLAKRQLNVQTRPGSRSDLRGIGTVHIQQRRQVARLKSLIQTLSFVRA